MNDLEILKAFVAANKHKPINSKTVNGGIIALVCHTGFIPDSGSEPSLLVP